MNEEFMMKGFTPFCIQQLDNDSEMSLILHEERMEQTTTTSYSDLEKKSKKLKITPISDILGFITIIANLHTLAKVLFSTTSPLTIGLQELQQIVLLGKQEGKLQKVSNFQPNYFAYAVWGIYECCDDFFKMRLSRQDLLEGACLRNPFKDFNYEISRWQEISRAGVPALLGYATKSTESPPENAKTLGKGKRKILEPEDDDEESAKKIKGSGKGKWKDNPCFDESLKKLKQNIIQANGRTNLGQLLRASNTTIPAALNTLGFQQNICGRWTLWGGCGDPKCTLTHMEKALPQAQIARVTSLLSDSAAKLAIKKAQS